MKKIIALLFLVVFTSACLENPIKEEIDQEKEALQNFDYSTISQVDLSISISDNQGTGIQGVLIKLWDTQDDEKNNVIFKGFTNRSGQIQASINLPSALDKVMIETNYIGVPNDVMIPIQAGVIDFSSRGGEVTSVVVQASEKAGSIYTGKSVANNVSNLTYNYLGAYNSSGVPDNLEAERDAISASLLEYINASLPENQPVPQYHPSYLANGKKTTLDIIELADVWITFVHEGAGFRNAIGFYTYETNSPQQSIKEPLLSCKNSI